MCDAVKLSITVTLTMSGLSSRITDCPCLQRWSVVLRHNSGRGPRNRRFV